MSTAAVESSDLQPMPWWMVLIEGIALLILGLMLLSNPGRTSVIAIMVIGFYWLVAGIIRIVGIFIDSSAWGWKLLIGIVGILAGIVVVRHPLWSTVFVGNTVVIFLGLAGIVMGVINVWHAIKGAGWGAGILGVVTFLLGLVLLFNAWFFTLSLPWTIGILSLVGGIAAIISAFRQRSDERAAADIQPAQPRRTDPIPASQLESSSAPAAAPAAVAATATAADAEMEDAAPEAVSAEVPAAEEAPAAEQDAATVEAAEDEEAAVGQEAGTQVSGVAAASHDLTYVEGIGPVHVQELKDAGIETPQQLLEKGATPKGRAELAQQTGISSKLILTWVNHVDLYRIKGIGSEYADLLEAAGVDTVPELAQRNPQNLHAKLTEVNEEKKLVRHVPAESQVVAWVAQAKELPRKVTY